MQDATYVKVRNLVGQCNIKLKVVVDFLLVACRLIFRLLKYANVRFET